MKGFRTNAADEHAKHAIDLRIGRRVRGRYVSELDCPLLLAMVKIYVGCCDVGLLDMVSQKTMEGQGHVIYCTKAADSEVFRWSFAFK